MGVPASTTITMSEQGLDDSGFYELVEPMGRLTIGENEENAIERGKDFVKDQFPNWEKGYYLLPEIFRDREEQDGTRAEWEVMKKIDHLARNETEKQPMFVVANIKGLKNDGECDMIIAHRRAGLKILQVKDGKPNNLSENIKKGLKQVSAWEKMIRDFYAKKFSEVDEIIRGKSGYVCVPFHSLGGSLEYRRDEGTLSRDDCESPNAFKTWWRTHILDENMELQRRNLWSDETYLNILSIILGGWCLRREGYRRNLGWLVPMVSNALANPVAVNQIENIPEPGFNPPYLKALMEWVKYESGKRIMTFKGVAGTGKTWLLIESASNILINDPESKMLVLCFNRALIKYLECEIKHLTEKKMNEMVLRTHQLNINVQTFDAFMGWTGGSWTDDGKKEDLQAKIEARQGICQDTYRHIFVDEGLDLCIYNTSGSRRLFSWIEYLEKIWDETGTFFLTFDEEQMVYCGQNLTAKEKNYLSQSKKLKTNIRSPRHICECFLAHVKEDVRSEVTMGHKIDGYPVKWQEPYLPVEPEHDRLRQGAENVLDIINECAAEGCDKEFVILTQSVPHRDQVIKQLNMTLNGKLSYSMYNAEYENKGSFHQPDEDPPQRKVLIVDSVRRFKGLEASIIILFDLLSDDILFPINPNLNLTPPLSPSFEFECLPSLAVVPESLPGDLPNNREEQDGTRAEWEVMKKIDHLARNETKRQPMFVVANIKGVKNDGECDMIIAHRRAGVKILQVKDGKPKNLSENIKKGLKQVTAWEKMIRDFYAKNFPESSVDEIIRGFREFRRNEGTLSRDDCESPDAFKTWWRTHILDENMELLPPDTYLNILSIILGGWCLRREGYRRNLGWLVPMVSNALANPVAVNQIENIPEPGFNPPYLKALMEWVKYESGKRIMTFKGVAGTGKTWLLIESASNILINDPESKMLVLCFNRALIKYLECEIKHLTDKKNNEMELRTRPLNINVQTFDAFMGWTGGIWNDGNKRIDLEAKIKKARQGICQDTYRHIFVDEGIDLCIYNNTSGSGRPVSWIEYLKKIWDKTGTFFLTFDEEQKVYYEQYLTEKERDYLSQSKKLKTNIRSPRHICECFLAHVKEDVRSEVTMGHKIDGYPVKWQEPYLPVEPEHDRLRQGAENVLDIIKECAAERYDKKFVILTRSVKHTEQVINQLNMTLNGNLSYSMYNAEYENKGSFDQPDEDPPQRKVLIVDSVRRFKGLEASIIIMFDFFPNDDALLYVGKSRSTCLLFILVFPINPNLNLTPPLSPSFEFECLPSLAVVPESLPGDLPNNSGFYELVEPMGRLTIGENEENAIERGKDFVKDQFPNWEKGYYLLPEIFRDREEQDGTRAEWEVMKKIDHLARNETEKQPMFVVANIKGLKNDGECDMIIAHRRAGLKILQVKDGKPNNLSENIKKGLKQVSAWEKMIRDFYAKKFSEVDEIIRGKSGYVCVPFHSLGGSLEYRRDEGTLSRDDCESPNAFKTWWRTHILDENMELQRRNLWSDETYLNILSIILGGWCLRREGYRRNLGWLVPMVSNALANPVAVNQIKYIPEPGFNPTYLKALMEWVKYESGKRIMTFKGVAGTGKTWLLIESASNILINDPESKMLVLCFNRALIKYLECEIKHLTEKKMNEMVLRTHQLNINVQTFDAFMGWTGGSWTDDGKKEDLQAKIEARQGICQDTYRHIFVDEGLDLCIYNTSGSRRLFSWIEYLEKIWDETGTFFLTFDEEQMVYCGQNLTAKEKNYLSQSKKLKTNIRSPRHICECFLAHVKEDVRSEVTMGHKIDGYPVKWQEPYLPVEPEHDRLRQGAENVLDIINECAAEGCDKEFVILTQSVPHRDQVIKQLNMTLNGKLSYSMYNAEYENKGSFHQPDEDPPQRKVLIVDSVRRFKGLEASIIILFDLLSDDNALLYVGKSRSTCLLFILGTKDDHRIIMEKEKVHTEKLRGKKRK
ncbi:unnamed protein product [Darwinula stevensoni]|uniref:Uncharacterized protein n=1 Tax=Darwinula stevensoni TaxID=69355 RepID=A0A7R9AH28_9CRUS|nr:unnamed protein product [Darwinula stevensoni]CAG0904001.1 unnamed protein product [Darwinula stevensoni]